MVCFYAISFIDYTPYFYVNVRIGGIINNRSLIKKGE